MTTLNVEAFPAPGRVAVEAVVEDHGTATVAIDGVCAGESYPGLHQVNSIIDVFDSR